MNCTSGVRLEIKIKFGHQGFAYLRQKFPKISEVKKKEFLLVHKLHKYLKTKTLAQNYILQREETERHFKTSADTS